MPTPPNSTSSYLRRESLLGDGGAEEEASCWKRQVLWGCSRVCVCVGWGVTSSRGYFKRMQGGKGQGREPVHCQVLLHTHHSGLVQAQRTVPSEYRYCHSSHTPGGIRGVPTAMTSGQVSMGLSLNAKLYSILTMNTSIPSHPIQFSNRVATDMDLPSTLSRIDRHGWGSSRFSGSVEGSSQKLLLEECAAGVPNLCCSCEILLAAEIINVNRAANGDLNLKGKGPSPLENGSENGTNQAVVFFGVSEMVNS